MATLLRWAYLKHCDVEMRGKLENAERDANILFRSARTTMVDGSPQQAFLDIMIGLVNPELSYFAHLKVQPYPVP